MRTADGRLASLAERWAPAALLVLCILATHFDTLCGATNLAGRYDNRDGAHPLRVEAARQWAEGSVPLWNPYKRAGMPLLADTTAGAIYPGNLPYLLYVLGLETTRYRTLDLVAVLHFVAAGLFMLGFLRTIGLGAAASVVGALMYSSSGTMTWLASYYIQMQSSAVWIPLILTAVHRIATRSERAGLWLAVGALAVALQFFAGYPEYSVYGGLVAAGYALSLVRRERVAQPLLALAGVYGAGMLLSAVQLVPSLELQSFARRPLELDLETFQSLPAAPAMIFNWVMPGVSAGTPFPPLGGYHLGVLAVALVAAGASMRHAARGFFVLLFVLAALLAVGSATPVSELAYRLPLIGSFRHPFKHLLELSLAASVLAALGLDGLLRTPERRYTVVAISMIASLGVIALSGVAGTTAGMLAIGASAVLTLVLLVSRGLVRSVAALAVALVASVIGYRMNVQAYIANLPETGTVDSTRPAVVELIDPRWRVLVPRRVFQARSSDSMIGDYPTEFRVPALGGAGPYLFKPLADATGMVEEETAFRPGFFAAHDRTLQVLATRYVVASRFGGGFHPALDESTYLPVYEDAHLRLTERADTFERFRLVGRVECSDAAGIERALHGDGRNLAELALIDCGEGARPPEAALASSSEGAVTVESEVGGMIVLATRLPPDRGGFVVASMAAYPGWRAYADGVERPLHRVYGLVYGVEIPPGTERLLLRYQPASFRVGAAVSLATSIVLFLVALRGRRASDSHA